MTISAIVTGQKAAATARPRGRDCRRRLYLVFVFLLVASGSAAWFERSALLQGLADLWVVSDPVTPADAVVVLGGGYDVRPIVAADLYAKGLVHKVLLSRVEDDHPSKFGPVSNNADINLIILRKLGVPDGVIGYFGEAKALGMKLLL